MADEQEVIFKVKKVQEGGAHGGAWKIAYADFVTAMMAFFLLLWLLNATEQEVMEGISNYFNPTTKVTSSASGSGGLLGGITSNEPGPTQDQMHTAALDRQTSTKGQLESETQGSGKDREESTGDVGEVNVEADKERFNKAKKLLEQEIDNLPPEFADLKQSIMIEITKDGLELTFIDQEQRSSFEPGTAILKERAKLFLQLISQELIKLPNKISITGHTDAGGEEKADWPLSIARANSARRELINWNVPADRFKTVTGKADTDLLTPDDPTGPQNRRISVLLVRLQPKKVYGGNGSNLPKPPSLLR